MTESPATATAPATLFGGYHPFPASFDEMAAEAGKPRDHWKKLATAFDRLGREELALRLETARRIIREHGVTYNVYGDPQGVDRPWELDMVPLLIQASEWKKVEAGLAQRTRLLNLILADLYGQQRLLRAGLLPPALVFANPGFLRPCHGVRLPKDLMLHLHAVDLARSPDGQWWALADRTQAPSGAGYTLENRIVLSRVLPEEFHDSQVQRLASFYRIQRDTLRRLAQTNRDNPTVVLMTPGPHNETYFEHAYLARYLGFPLVEGGDLTVRDRCVYIKTLEGLQQVDVILRRVDDTFCDPLELRGDSFLGVAGLVEAVRAGNVTVANALGSGLLESPAFLAFLPWLCRHLLGEELKLPSVATWWCGQGKEQKYVLENLDKIVVKPTFRSITRKQHFGAKMAAKERELLLAAIQARPNEFVGQERVALSMAPTWNNQRLEPRPVVVRTYVCAGLDSFVVMPGGLTRVSVATEDPVVSMQSGGGSKDTWVISDGPVAPVSMSPSSDQLTRSERASTELPSRVGDNLYWLGRYAERLEGTLRLLRCVIARMLDEAGSEGSPEVLALSQVLFRLGLAPARFEGRVPLRDMEQQVLQLVYNHKRSGSVRELLLRIRQLASMVRDRFSLDTWRIVNKLHVDSRSRPGRIPMANALALMNTLIMDLAAFSGMEMENMTRGHGWRFLDFGRRLERATNLANLLRAGLSTDIKTSAILEPLLEIADSSLTYRRRYFAQAQLPGVLDLLLMDAGNPRSLAFQLKELVEHVRNMPADPSGARGDARVAGVGSVRFLPVDPIGLDENDEPINVAALRNRLASANPRSLSHAREEGLTDPVDELLGEMTGGLAKLSEQLTHRYFSHTVMHTS
jgi:uncharacterized circularly permuted ATP-grasp superfamily protein/uncharacterized alpha-E superfamily protein